MWNKEQNFVGLKIGKARIFGVHVPNAEVQNRDSTAKWLAKLDANFILGDFSKQFSSNKRTRTLADPAVRDVPRPGDGKTNAQIRFFNSNLIMGANHPATVNFLQCSNGAGNTHLMGAGIDNTENVIMKWPLELIPEYCPIRNLVFSDHPSLFTKLSVLV